MTWFRWCAHGSGQDSFDIPDKQRYFALKWGLFFFRLLVYFSALFFTLRAGWVTGVCHRFSLPIFQFKKEVGGAEKERKQNQARELVARNGRSHLATSIGLSLLFFGLCYVLTDGGWMSRPSF